MAEETMPPEEQRAPPTNPQEAMATPRQPSVSKEEQLLQGASEDVKNEEFLSGTTSGDPPPKKQRHFKFKKLVKIVLVIVLVGGAGIAAWKLYARKASSNDDSAKSSSSSTPAQAIMLNSLKPNSIAYAYRASSGDAYTAYWRPAQGGDRKEALVGFEKNDPYFSDVRGTSAVFATSDAIYASTDSGKSYKKIRGIKAGEAVTSLRLSTDGSAVAYGFLADPDGKNTVKSMSLQGKDGGDLFKDDKAGVFIHQWNKSQQKIFYTDGCMNCDGNAPGDNLRDLKTGKVTNPITQGQKIYLKTQPQISDDFSRLIYLQGEPVSSTGAAALGEFADPPYKINVLTLANDKVTTAATVGEKDAKNTNGTKKDWTVQTGFAADGTTPYYAAEEGTVYLIEDGTASSLVPTGQIIQAIKYVSSDKVILATVKDASATDFDVQIYDVPSKKNTLILQGDANTFIFGVTTK